MKKVLKKKAGFTLIELVIVIAIISVLIGIGVPKYNNSRKKAVVAAHNSNVKAVENATLLYLTENEEKDKDKEIASADLNKYFSNGKMPKALINSDNKEVKDGTFTVSVDNSKINVSPGMKVFEDGKIKDDNKQK